MLNLFLQETDMGNKITYERVSIFDLSEEKLMELATLFDEIFPGFVNLNAKRREIENNMQFEEYSDAQWLLASKGDKIVGMVANVDIRVMHSGKTTVCNYMYNLGVKKEYRNKGIGHMLFKTAFVNTDKKMSFGVDKNKPELIEMYKKWGATIEAVFVDDITMCMDQHGGGEW